MAISLVDKSFVMPTCRRGNEGLKTWNGSNSSLLCSIRNSIILVPGEMLIYQCLNDVTTSEWE